MPLGDVFFKFKLIFLGFLFPAFGMFILLLTAPYLIRYGGLWKKAEVLVLEVGSLSTSKRWRVIGNLKNNGIFEKAYIIFPDISPLERNILTVSNRELVVREFLRGQGLEDSEIKFFHFQEGEVGSSYQNAKNLLKALVNDEVGSVLIFSDEFSSQRILNTYSKHLMPIGIEVSVYPSQSEYRATTWFLSENGVKHITQELYLYLFYKIRGYY